MDWIYLLALLPAALLFGNGRYLLATAVLFIIPLWFFSPVVASVCWLISCLVAMRGQKGLLKRGR